jgi:outer membrane protein assembly factor BamD
MLVRHELYVARFYLRTDHFEAAQRRVQYALRNYAGTGLDPEAVVLLGEIYLKQKQLDQAEALFQHVLAKFPESEFRVPAERFLASMEERKKKTPNTSP